MHVIKAVFKRNFVSYLSGVIGYMFMAVFLGAAAFAAFNEQFFANNLANLDQLNLWFPLLLVVLIPAITMSSWADERRFGTDEILFTLPATDMQILLGKYLAVLGVYTVTLLFGGGLGLALCFMRNGLPDVGLILSSFVGYWFAGAALLAAGMVASAASRSPTVAYLLGLFIGGVPVLLTYVSSNLSNYSVAANMRDFGLGLLAPAGITYFLSLIILMLFMNYILITGRFWSTGPGRASMLVGVCVAVMLPLVIWFATQGESRQLVSFLDGFADWIPPLANIENRSAVRAGLLTVLLLVGYAAWAYLMTLVSDRINPTVSLGVGAVVVALMLASFLTSGLFHPLVIRLGVVAVLVSGLLLARSCKGEQREWRSALLYATEFVALGVILFAVNQAVAAVNFPLDVTREQLYSLSRSTRQTLNELSNSKEQQEVHIHAFVSPEVPKQYAGVRNTLLGLLRSYNGGPITVHLQDTQPYTTAASDAKKFGIDPQRIPSEQGGRFVTNQVFMGVAITSRDQEVVIPFFDLGTPVEYELTRSIYTLTRPKRKKVGILKTDASINGGFNMQAMSRTPEWRFVTELKKQYDVKDVTTAELRDQTFDALVAVMPSSLTAEELPDLVAYIQAGKPTLVIDDPFPYFTPQLAPRMPKPSQGGGMMGRAPPPQPKADNGSLKPLMDAIDLEWTPGETVWDPYNPHPELNEISEILDLVFVDINSNAGDGKPPVEIFSQKSPITKGMQQVIMLYPGSLRAKANSAMDHTGLVRASRRANVRQWDEYMKEGQMNPFMGGGGPELQESLDPLAPNPDSDVPYMMACHCKSKDGAKRKANVVMIADLDMISNQFFLVRDKEWNNLQLDNIALILNSVDVLADDLTNVGLRTRRSQHLTLARVDAARKAVLDTQIEAVKEARKAAEKQSEDASKRFKQRGEAIMKRTDLSESQKELLVSQLHQDESRRLAIEVAQIKQQTEEKVQQTKEQSRADILRTESWFRWTAILLVPLPVILLGAFVGIRRAADERQGIVPDRLVKHHKK